MSGHSKWSKVKHQKEVTDAKKGKLYTIFAKKILTAYREGKGLQQAILQAKEVSVPKEIIERAIAKGAVNPNNVKEVIFDGFFLDGKVNLLILGETDNTTRTSNQIKNVLEKHGGRLGNPGSTNYLFKKCAIIYIPKSEANVEIILESDANDLKDEDDHIAVNVEFNKLHNVTDLLKQKNIEMISEEIEYLPEVEILLSTEELNKYTNLISDLTAIGEIESVFSNVKN
jgi:YebC/PmpR family DNA-binding regulatory protein